MSKTYIGVNNIPKLVEHAYIGINNKARKIAKVYIGDQNNKPQLVFFDEFTAEIPVPTAKTIYSYTGAVITPEFNNYSTSALEISGDYTSKDVGTHLAIFTPKPGYIWEDSKNQEPKVVPWIVTPTIVVVPKLAAVDYTYTQDTITVSWDKYYDANKMTITGHQNTVVGTYTATLTPKNGYVWLDGTEAATKEYTWNIVPKPITIPTIPNWDSKYTYNGSVQTITTSTGEAYDSKWMNRSNITNTNAGIYFANFDLKDKVNTVWQDGNTLPKNIKWMINQAIVVAPTQKTSRTYTGSAITADWNNYDTSKMTLSGGTSTATEGGTYAAIFKITNNNYKFHKGATLTNLLSVSNMSLSNVTKSGDNVFTFAGNDGTEMITQTLPTPIAGHKYYGRVEQKVEPGATFADSRFEYFGGDGTGYNIVFSSFEGATKDNEWHIDSSVQSFPSILGSSWNLRSFAVNPTKTVYRRNHMIIDLTAAYGAGYEPTAEWCDANIPYFEGNLVIPGTGESEFKTNDTIDAYWKISRSTAAKVSISPTSATWNKELGTKTFTISNPSGGALSTASSGNFNASISGTTLSVSHTVNETASATITINSAVSTNYEASSCTLECNSILGTTHVKFTGSGRDGIAVVHLSGISGPDPIVSAGEYDWPWGGVIQFHVASGNSSSTSYVSYNGVTKVSTTGSAKHWDLTLDSSLTNVTANFSVSSGTSGKSTYYYGSITVTSS